MADESRVDDLPVEDAQAAEVVDTDTSAADDGEAVGIAATDAVITGEVDDSTTAEVEEEDGQHGDDEEEEPQDTEPWDKERQDKDQTIAQQRKEIEQLKADQAPEAETQTTPEPAADSFDDLFEKADAAEAASKTDDAGDTSDDLDDYDKLEQRMKAADKRIDLLEDNRRQRESSDKLRASYNKHLKSHDLDANQTAELNKRVHADLVKRGYTEAKLPGEDQFDDLVGRVAAEMQNEALQKTPTRRRRSKPSTPKPSSGSRGAPARTPGAPSKLQTIDEAMADMDATPPSQRTW